MEKIKIEKAKACFNDYFTPRQTIKVSCVEDYSNLLNTYPDKIILIGFLANSYESSKFFAPFNDQIQKEYGKDFVFVKVDIEENRDLAIEYRITAIPTTIFVQNGSVVDKVVGSLPYAAMKTILEKVKAPYN